MMLNNLALKLNSGLIQMNINNGIVLLFISGLSVLLLAAPAASDGPPQMPMILHGDIQVNSQSAPVGTIIAAYVGDTQLGSIQVEVTGQYGDEPNNRLVVNEPPGTDNVIHIYIQTPSMSTRVEAEQTIVWDVGEIKILDLTAVYTEGSNDGSSGGGGGSTSTVVDSTETAVAGGIGAEKTDPTIKATGTTTPDAESPKSTGTSSLLITIALIAIVAIIVFVAYKKFK
jgi:hypothetical protein